MKFFYSPFRSMTRRNRAPVSVLGDAVHVPAFRLGSATAPMANGTFGALAVMPKNPVPRSTINDSSIIKGE